MIYGIVAKSKDNIIGTLDNKMPWYVPEDLGYFKRKTNDKIVVMGHKTHRSIGKILSNRTNKVLSRDQQLIIKDAVVCHDVKSCLEEKDIKDIYIIGGSEVFKLFEEYIDIFYVTEIDIEIEEGVKIDLSAYKKIEEGEWQLSRTGAKYRHTLYMHR